jgi:NADH-quinone oxidoreductase subunit L
MGVALAGGIVGILWARRQFITQKSLPKADEQMEGFAKVVYHKYYVDEAYVRLIVNPINSASRFFRDTIETSLSAVVLGMAKATLAIGAQGRKVHNGNTGLYLFAFVLGVIALVTYLFIVQ